MNLMEFSHRRYNILTGEWVLVSPHRAKRPWQGQQEKAATEKRPAYDPACYLCAGNTRANGAVNPAYKDVYVFDNDFAALREDVPEFSVHEGLLSAQGERGICRVLCFSPDHSKSLADMSVPQIVRVVAAWIDQYLELGQKPWINHVQIFENKGAVMGCSNPHPHGQIWSQATLPNEAAKKDTCQKAYFIKHGRFLLEDYLEQERILDERILYENEHCLALVPFWAVWPFEIMILPKEVQPHIGLMVPEQQASFADCISAVTRTYDRVFKCSFPYSAGIHQAPTNGQQNSHWHWHMSFYPPLLRSATIKKFMVGYEMFGSPQRDITPEQAAQLLKSLI